MIEQKFLVCFCILVAALLAAKTKLIMDQRKVFKKHLDILCINTEMQVNSSENAVGNLCC